MDPSTVPDVAGGESVVTLPHVLGLHQHHRVEIPTTAHLEPVRVHVTRHRGGQAARHDVVAIGAEELVVLAEAIDRLTGPLSSRVIPALGRALASRPLGHRNGVPATD